jgi:hypothetical protein
MCELLLGTWLGEMGDWESTKDKPAEIWDQVVWVLWWRYTTAVTTSSKFIITATSKEVNTEVNRASVLRVVWPCRGNCNCYFLQLLFLPEGHGVNILVVMLSSYAAFCSCSLLQLGTVLIPACRLFDMAVLMSSPHGLIIICSPHILTLAGCQRLTPVILATQEVVWSQPKQIIPWNPVLKKPFKKRAWQSGSRCIPRVQAPVLEKKTIYIDFSCYLFDVKSTLHDNILIIGIYCFQATAFFHLSIVVFLWTQSESLW